MYKNQLQELAQRSCFNLPSYSCLREGPDHSPRFKSTVNFNGEIFGSSNFCTTLRQAEHSAAEVALNSLSNTGRPSHSHSHSLAARILDETGVYKNLLQENSQRVGASLPLYTTTRSGLGHLPVFTCKVELAGITFIGEPAKNKKQAEKNAAMAAWLSLKQLAREDVSSSSEAENNDELEQVTIARALLNYRLKENIAVANSPAQQKPFQRKFPLQNPRPAQPPPVSTSRILPLIHPRTAPRNQHTSTTASDNPQYSQLLYSEYSGGRLQKYPQAGAAGAAPYIPVQYFRAPYHGMAPQVTMRTMIPVFSAPPLPARTNQPPILRHPPVCIAPPVRIRQAVPAFTAPIVRTERQQRPSVQIVPPPTTSLSVKIEEIQNVTENGQSDTVPSQGLKELKI